MSAGILPYLGAVLVAGAAAVTWAARLAPSAGAKDTTFTEPVPGGRWLQCDELRCAHLTRLHLPVGDGRWQCSNCSTVKGGSS